MSPIKVKYKDIYPHLIQGLTNVKSLWLSTSDMMEQSVGQIFESEGGTWGVAKWLPIKSILYGKIRYGTDGNEWGRYSSSSRVLQASGKYRNSFKRISIRPLQMVWGSSYRFGSGGKTVSGDVIPFAGRGSLKPREPMPNSESGRFQFELQKREQAYLNKVVKDAFSKAREVVK